MISSDAKYWLKLTLTKSHFFKETAGGLILIIASMLLKQKKYWLFCKFLGKYEKLNEERILKQDLSNKYKELFQLRNKLICPEADNLIYKDFLRSKQAAAIKNLYKNFDVNDHVRIRYRNEDDPLREGNFLVLKTPQEKADGQIEKGVLYLQYNNSIPELAALFDLAKLYQDYAVIIEPSSWGYCDLGLELLLHGNNTIYVMAQDSIDYQLCLRLDKRLVPIRAGAGDWINFNAVPATQSDKIFDVCMVASWRKLKNHKLLFKQLAQLGKGLRIALIGYPWEKRTAASIRAEQNKFYPDSLVSIFESVPHEYVFKVLSQSKVALMLSEREGANRGIYEALASNVPVVMLDNNRGVNKLMVTQGCITTTSAENLGVTVRKVLSNNEANHVRDKLLEISGTDNTWRKISETLWATEGIKLSDTPLIRSTPNLKYVSQDTKENMDATYHQLKSYLTSAYPQQ
ncbi:MAG: hypothetical protein B0W54_13450 [Cellvibrio sp. 79]|nr:MAG: hypothetical protein B0W54_13450 [Cellvibrio sp. 79]